MDSAHLHLLINHVPVLATVFSSLILLWGIIRSEKQVCIVALTGFVIAAIFSLVAMQSGEGAEEIVEEIAGVTHAVIHDHEEAAELANWIALAVGLASAGGLYLLVKRPSVSKKLLWGLLLFGLISTAQFTYTAYQGGEIRHTEIRGDSATQSETISSADEEDEHEDSSDSH